MNEMFSKPLLVFVIYRLKYIIVGPIHFLNYSVNISGIFETFDCFCLSYDTIMHFDARLHQLNECDKQGRLL